MSSSVGNAEGCVDDGLMDAGRCEIKLSPSRGSVFGQFNPQRRKVQQWRSQGSKARLHATMNAGRIGKTETAQQCKTANAACEQMISLPFVRSSLLEFFDAVCVRWKERMDEEVVLLKTDQKVTPLLYIYCSREICTVGRKAQLWGWAAGHPRFWWRIQGPRLGDWPEFVRPIQVPLYL